MHDTPLELIESASGTNRLRQAAAREVWRGGRRKEGEQEQVRSEGRQSDTAGWMNNAASADSGGRDKAAETKSRKPK